MSKTVNLRGTSELHFRIGIGNPSIPFATLYVGSGDPGTSPPTPVPPGLQNGDLFIRNDSPNEGIYQYDMVGVTWNKLASTGGGGATIFSGDVQVQGDFDTWGHLIELNSAESGAGISHIDQEGGIEINRGTLDNAKWIFDENNDWWQPDSIDVGINNVFVPGNLLVGTGGLTIPTSTTSGFPPLHFFGDEDTGISRVSTNILGFDTDGSVRWSIDSVGNFAPSGSYDIGNNSFPVQDTYSDRILTDDGTDLLPSHSFRGTPNAGMFLSGIDEIGFSTNANQVMTIHQNGVLTVETAGYATLVTAAGDTALTNKKYVDDAVSASATTFPLYSTTDGTSVLPAYSFTSSSGDGMYRTGGSDLAFSIGTTDRLWLESGGVISTQVPNYDLLVLADNHIPNLKKVQSEIASISWKEPVVVKDDTVYISIPFAEVAMNTGFVDGVAVVNGSRILYTAIGGSPADIYVINGVPGAGATLVQITPVSFDGTTAYVVNGTSAGIVFNFNVGNVWQKSGLYNVVEDLTPQLGGNLDVNDFEIVGKPPATATSTGGAVNITSGTGGATSGGGGNITVTGGDATSGNYSGGDIRLYAGDSTGTQAGGEIKVYGGDAYGSSAGGQALIRPGRGGSTGLGGNLNLHGGVGGTASGNGGGVNIYGGAAVDGNGGFVNIVGRNASGTDNDGGDVSIDGGNATGTGAAGTVDITAGDAATTGAGADITVTGGTGGATSGDGGGVTITGGASPTSGSGGDVLIEGGAGQIDNSGSPGKVTIRSGVGQSFTSDITIETPDALGNDDSTGDILIQTGQGDGFGDSGEIVIQTLGNSATGDSGDITLETRNTANSPGTIELKAGSVTGAGSQEGGDISIRSGNTSGTGGGGDIQISSGRSYANGGTATINMPGAGGGQNYGNPIRVQAGDGSGSNADGGNISIASGRADGSGTDGRINLITSNNGDVIIGSRESSGYTPGLRFAANYSGGSPSSQSAGSTSDYVKLVAPSTLTGSQNVTYTLPYPAPATDGYLLQSTTGGVMSWLKPNIDTAHKTSLTSRSSDATPSDDPDLTFTMSETTAYYAVEALIIVNEGGATGIPDFLFGFTVPTAAAFNGDFIAIESGVGIIDSDVVSAASNRAVQISGSQTHNIKIQGRLLIGANTGTFAIKWSQNTSDASPMRVNAGSYVVLTKL